MKHNFDEEINRQGTYCTQWDYIKDRFGKEDLLPFSISDTDFKVPKEVHEKLQEVIDHQIYGYSRWNHHDFKSAIAYHFKQQCNSEIHEEWVLYGPSVLYSISLLLRLLSKKGEGIISFTPMYDAFYHVIGDNHRKLLPVNLIEKDGLFSIDTKQLEESLKQAKILLLCSPHNPTGKIFTKTEIELLIALCQKHQVAIISDEIHMDVIMPGNTFISMSSYLKDYPDIYIVSSGSKTFNYPGLIGSYAIIAKNTVYDAYIHQTRYQDFLNSVSLLGMHAMIVSYTKCHYYIAELRTYIYDNFVYLKQYIDTHFPDIHFTIPNATYLAWIDCRNLPFTSEQMQEALINVGGVGIMAGEVYGGEKYLRLNCGCPKHKLKEGMKRFKQAIDSLYQEL